MINVRFSTFNYVHKEKYVYNHVHKYVQNYVHKVTTTKNIVSSVYVAGKTCFNKYFLDRRQRGPIRSVLLVIIGWLLGLLVTQFSQKRL